jgi:two-component system, NarL family, sensor histidine kinase DegS
MKNVTKIFLLQRKAAVNNLHLWIIIFVLVIFTIIYYLLQYFWIIIFQQSPLAQSFVTWEYVHNLTGSLFLVPIIYSIFLFWWRGTLIVWLVSMLVVLPRILYFYGDNITRTLLNIFYLSIPVLILSYVILELRWREKERQQLAEREKERQNYLSQVFKAQEEERKRLAREIHDDPIQRLSVIAINAKILTQNTKLDNLSDIKEKVDSMRDMINSVSKDLRRMTLDLRPTVLDDLGLIPALRWMINGFNQETGIETRIEITGEEKPISQTQSINIFRIIQEALNNIRKHAKATIIEVSIQYINGSMNVSISDNGVGFLIPRNDSELTAQGKLGLIGMQQRAQFINGKIQIQSGIGEGTRVTLHVEAD